MMSDLNYSCELHKFLKNEIDIPTYFAAEYGFQKFLHDYGVNRTLKAGDLPKRKILKLIKSYPFSSSHATDITKLALNIQQNKLSSQSAGGSHGLPQSFCSKFLYVLKPDQLIPYDSYVLKSLQLRTGNSLKSLEQYYDHADKFRRTHFPENGPEVKKIRDKSDPDFRKQLNRLNINDDKVLSWKLTDKYLWCEHEERRKTK